MSRGNSDLTSGPAVGFAPQAARRPSEAAPPIAARSSSHCAGCGHPLRADQIAASIAGRGGARLDFCRQCASGQTVLNLRTPEAKP
jgi:hypothetical protein